MHARKMSARKGVLILLPAIALLLGGCEGTSWVTSNVSPNAAMTRDITVLLTVIAVAVFVVVEALLLYAAFRFSRPRAGEAQQTEGNQRIEIAWTVAPAVVLFILFVVSLQTLMGVSYSPEPARSGEGAFQGNALRVRAIGHQWWWEFDYPDYAFVTANVLHVPIGTVVNVEIESVDVIHSFWVPQLAGKTDAIPGQVNRMWFQANLGGTYLGQCAEFCGAQHADMRIQVIAEPSDAFEAWAKEQQAPVAQMTDAQSKQGEATFMTGACIGCHAINGTNAKGTMGPNLTKFGLRESFAGAILPNTPENVAAWLANPQKVKPANQMPNLGLSQEQIDQLVAYLENLK